MKKIISSLTLLLFAAKLFSQQPAKAPFSKDYYLHKSKSQKTTAWILLGTGLGMVVAGSIIQAKIDNRSYDGQSEGFGFASGLDFDFTGAGIAVGGGLVALSSVPFFISSSKKCKKSCNYIYK